MKILFYEVRHFSPNFHEFTGSKTIFANKKNRLFSPKIGEKKNCQNLFQTILRLKKEKKKVVWTTKSLVQGGQNLSGPTTKKNTFFYVCLPLQDNGKVSCSTSGPVKTMHVHIVQQSKKYIVEKRLLQQFKKTYHVFTKNAWLV